MSFQSGSCILHSGRVYEDLEAHIASEHDDPEEKIHADALYSQPMTDADYVRLHFAFSDTGADAVVGNISGSVSRPGFHEIGVTKQQIMQVRVSAESGAWVGPNEMNRIFTILAKDFGGPIDRAAVIVDLFVIGIDTDFSEEVSAAGAFTVQSPISREEKVYTIEAFVNLINNELMAGETAREFKFRRLARAFALDFDQLRQNPAIARYEVTGTSISNRLSVKPSIWYCTQSWFPFYKSGNKWSEEERKGYEAKITNTLAKQSRESNEPRDLRIHPEMASEDLVGGESDFHVIAEGRHSRLSALQNHWKKKPQRGRKGVQLSDADVSF